MFRFTSLAMMRLAFTLCSRLVKLWLLGLMMRPRTLLVPLASVRLSPCVEQALSMQCISMLLCMRLSVVAVMLLVLKMSEFRLWCRRGLLWTENYAGKTAWLVRLSRNEVP